MFREWAKRFEFLLHRRQRMEDLESEMCFHRELRAAKLRSEGIPEQGSGCTACRRFGNSTLMKEISETMRTLPVHNPKQVYFLRVLPGTPEGAGNTGNGESSFSEYVFEQFRTQHQAFSSLAAYVPAGYNKIEVRTGAVPEEAAVDMVSKNFFSGLGVHAICGRKCSA